MKSKDKDPLLLADDDHPDRVDISEKEFDKGLLELKKKFGVKKQSEPKTNFSKGVVDALNSIQQ